MVSAEDKFKTLIDKFFLPEEPDTSVFARELSPESQVIEEYRYGERTFLSSPSSAAARLVIIGERTWDDDTSSNTLCYHAPHIYHRVKRLLASCHRNGISPPSDLQNILRLNRLQEKRSIMLYVGRLSLYGQERHVESRTANISVEFLSEKYRYCRNKVVHREAVDLRHIRVPGPFSPAVTTCFGDSVEGDCVYDGDPKEAAGAGAMAGDHGNSSRILQSSFQNIEISEIEKGSAAESSGTKLCTGNFSGRKRKSDIELKGTGFAREDKEAKTTMVLADSNSGGGGRKGPVQSNQKASREETRDDTQRGAGAGQQTNRRSGGQKTSKAVALCAIQKDNLCFFPAYDEDKFVEVNVNVPLQTLFPLLVLYNICQAKLIKRKMEGYACDRISARTLINDLSLYCKIYGADGIDFDSHLDRIESGIADVTRRCSEDIELFKSFTLMKRIHVRQAAASPTPDGEDTDVSLNGAAPRLTPNETSSLFCKILQHLKGLSKLSGWMRVYAIWESVRVYENKGISIRKGLIEDLIGEIKITRYFSLAAIKAISEMGLRVPKTLRYTKLIDELAEAFGKALDKSIKEGYPTTNLFETAGRLAEVDAGCSGECREYARRTMETVLQRKLMRRIEKASKLQEIESIERAYNGASRYFGSLERVCWALVAKKMGFTHHQLLKN